MSSRAITSGPSRTEPRPLERSKRRTPEQRTHLQPFGQFANADAQSNWDRGTTTIVTNGSSTSILIVPITNPASVPPTPSKLSPAIRNPVSSSWENRPGTPSRATILESPPPGPAASEMAWPGVRQQPRHDGQQWDNRWHGHGRRQYHLGQHDRRRRRHPWSGGSQPTGRECRRRQLDRDRQE